MAPVLIVTFLAAWRGLGAESQRRHWIDWPRFPKSFPADATRPRPLDTFRPGLSWPRSIRLYAETGKQIAASNPRRLWSRQSDEVASARERLVPAGCRRPETRGSTNLPP